MWKFFRHPFPTPINIYGRKESVSGGGGWHDKILWPQPDSYFVSKRLYISQKKRKRKIDSNYFFYLCQLVFGLLHDQLQRVSLAEDLARLYLPVERPVQKRPRNLSAKHVGHFADRLRVRFHFLQVRLPRVKQLAREWGPVKKKKKQK